MDKIYINAACVGLFATGMASSSILHAYTYSVADNYIGQSNGSFENTQDATSADFNITGMDYSNDGTSVSFTFQSFEDPTFGSYFDDWVNDDSAFKPGDLFLSTDGWNPYTNGSETQPGYGYDAFDEFNQTQNGESWEYVIQLAGQEDFFNGPQSSGSTQLYRTSDGGEIVKGSIRGSQEALYDTDSFFGDDNNNPLGAGSWNIFDADNNGIMDSMTITMLLTDGFSTVLDDTGANDLGFHWTMSCANDVIEGSISTVPVPAAVWLFGSGLLGLVGIAHRRKS